MIRVFIVLIVALASTYRRGRLAVSRRGRTISSAIRRSLPARTTATSSSSPTTSSAISTAATRFPSAAPSRNMSRRCRPGRAATTAPACACASWAPASRRRRDGDRHLHPRAGRQPLPGRQPVDVWRQLQPRHEPDGAERAARTSRRISPTSTRPASPTSRRWCGIRRSARRTRRSSSPAGRRAARSAGGSRATRTVTPHLAGLLLARLDARRRVPEVAGR